MNHCLNFLKHNWSNPWLNNSLGLSSLLISLAKLMCLLFKLHTIQWGQHSVSPKQGTFIALTRWYISSVQWCLGTTWQALMDSGWITAASVQGVRRPSACSACRGRHRWCRAHVEAPPPHCWCWECPLEHPRSGCKGCTSLWRDAWWSWQTPCNDHYIIITLNVAGTKLFIFSSCIRTGLTSMFMFR